MNSIEKIRRINNPTCLSDYGLSVNLIEVMREIVGNEEADAYLKELDDEAKVNKEIMSSFMNQSVLTRNRMFEDAFNDDTK